METAQALECIKRLSGLRGYEKLKDELMRIAEKYGQNHTRLYGVITDILESETTCPTPAALRGFLTAGTAKEDEGWKQHRQCPYALCCGDGWRVYYSLHTRTSNGTTRESLNEEQAADLRRKVDPNKQIVYDGVGPCKCAGKGVPVVNQSVMEH
jgi:hypothetical protein